MRVVTTRVSGSLPAEPPLSEAAAEAWIPRTCFKKGPPGRVGVEIELLVAGPDGLATPYPRHRYPQLINGLGAGSGSSADGDLDGRITVEPGGQVELSSRPGDTLTDTVATTHHDLSLLHRRAAARGVRLIGLGVDPHRAPRRVTTAARYVQMERYLRPWGAAGPAMMCSTASVQVNVEAATGSGRPGDEPAASDLADLTGRWELLHAVGPTLVAAFANSPRRCGRPTGFKSTRMAIWHSLDPARTGIPHRRPDEDVPTAWTRWALDAPLMLVRRPSGDWSAPRGLSFRGWLRHGRGAVPDRPPPTVDDLAYHLTTLFPHVRPRGHLEVRYLDAQPGCCWIAPTATLAALLDDPSAADRARDACAAGEGRWLEAARLGLADPVLARSAGAVLTLAAESLGRRSPTAAMAAHLEGYLQRWTLRGCSPADDPPDQAGPTLPGHCPVPGCDRAPANEAGYRKGSA